MEADKTSSYYKRLQAARTGLGKWNDECQERREANPIDWAATAEAGKVVFKKSK
jgi:hypothetical protein